jgi:hypothetical protein
MMYGNVAKAAREQSLTYNLFSLCFDYGPGIRAIVFIKGVPLGFLVLGPWVKSMIILNLFLNVTEKGDKSGKAI